MAAAGRKLIDFVMRKLLSKKLSRKRGIETLAGPEQNTVLEIQSKQLFNDMSNAGFDMNKIKENDVMYFLNLKRQKMDEMVKSQFGELDLGQGIKSLEQKKPPFQGWTPKVVKTDPHEKKKSMFEKHQKELKDVDTDTGMKFYSDLSDTMKRQDLEELELDYDTMFNKLVEKAKRIDADPKVLLEAELGKKLTGKETTTQLLDIFKNRPKKASGGRIGMAIGGFTKAQVLIQMIKNTLKESKDPYVKKTFPNFIKELTKNPELANDPNVWKQFTTGLPKNQRLVVHSDDSVDFFTQSEFGPHNIEKTLEFQKKHNLSREQANTILKMEPEDRVLEMKRIETIRNKTMQAEGGRIGMMYGGDPGFAFEYGGSWADWHEQHRDTMPVEQYIQTKLPKERLPFREMQEGGLAYMLGEPTYMKYGAGGSVGHAPWHKPTGQPQPQQQLDTPAPQVGGAQTPGRGQPNPMKGPRGLPSLAPKNMDPAFMQQQAMQKAMMGQGQPRMRAAQGRFIDSVGIGPLNINPRIGISETETTEPYQGPDSPIVDKEIGATNIGADIMLDIGKGIYGKAEYDKGRESKDIYYEGEKVLENVPYDHDIWKYGGGFEKDGTRAEVVYDPEAERWEFKLVKSFNQGGRIGFGLGGIDKGRRAFMKWLAGITAGGIAAGTGLLKLSKAAKVVPKVTETIVQSNAAGMPAWFPSLVKRVLKEGKDETAKLGTLERQTVHTTKLPTSGTPIRVTRDLVTDDIIVDIGEQTKHGWGAGRHGQPTRLELKKGEWIEPTKGKKGIKTKDEFSVEEAEFTGGHPENIKFEETVQFKYGDHGSDFREVEKYAIGKNKDKNLVGKQRDKDNWAEGRAEAEAEAQRVDNPDIEYASGGLAYLLGE